MILLSRAELDVLDAVPLDRLLKIAVGDERHLVPTFFSSIAVPSIGYTSPALPNGEKINRTDTAFPKKSPGRTSAAKSNR